MNSPAGKGNAFEIFAWVIGAGLVALIIWDIAILFRASQGGTAPSAASFEARLMARGASAGVAIVAKITLEAIAAKLVYLMGLIGLSSLRASAGHPTTKPIPATSAAPAGPVRGGAVSSFKEGGWTDAEGSHKDGKNEGVWLYRHDNGRKAIEGTYKEGKPEGIWTYFHDNSVKEAEGTYQAGKQEGAWTYWHDNGQKQKEGSFKGGEKAGAWTYWHSNGQKWSEGTYVNGKKEGVWTRWYDNGQKQSEVTWKDGERVK